MVRTGLLFGFLALFIAVPLFYCENRLGRIRDSYSQECANKVTPAKEQGDWSLAANSMQKQSELLLSWSIAIAAGIVAVITVKSLHHFKAIRWLYLPLALALIFLVESMSSANFFQRRLTYLELNKCLASGGDLNELLLAQTDFFLYAILALAFFAFCCIFQIMAGWVDFGSQKP